MWAYILPLCPLRGVPAGGDMGAWHRRVTPGGGAVVEGAKDPSHLRHYVTAHPRRGHGLVG